MLDHQENLIAKARAMAEDFAKLKTPKFLEAFLTDTLIAQEFKRLEESEIPDDRYLKLLVNEYHIPFGQALALAYVMGYMDSAEHIKTAAYRNNEIKLQDGQSPCSLVTGNETDA